MQNSPTILLVQTIMLRRVLMFSFSAFFALFAINAFGCTSAIIGAETSLSGRPMLWKHRDTGTEHNFVTRVARKGQIPYVALFNGGDSLLAEAWMGLNAEGFAIMNTASYNLAPDTASYKDREGYLMSEALAKCSTLRDFENLLDTLPKPMGVQANFGIIDASGAGAYYETDDYRYTKYSIDDTPDKLLLRTNYSCSGDSTCGMGYIRYQNAATLLSPHIKARDITPATFTEELSRSFYHSLLGRDPMADGDSWAIDQDFIPRHSSSASIVIEGIRPGESPALSVMWTAIGYPPCATIIPVTVDSVPDRLQPRPPLWRCPECDYTLTLKRLAFPITRGSGRHYIDLNALRPIIGERHQKSEATYRGFREKSTDK